MANTTSATENKPKRRACTSLSAPSPESLRSASTNRAFNTFARAVGKETTKANRLQLERRKAFTATIDVWLEELDDEAREAFFLSIEAVATVANARRIATHPLRPEWLGEEDGMEDDTPADVAEKNRKVSVKETEAETAAE